MASKTGVQTPKEPSNTPERAGSFDTLRVLALLPLRPYQVILDLPGELESSAIALAKYLFDGKVYALAPAQEQKDALHKKLEELRLTNVELVAGGLSQLPSMTEQFDGAVLSGLLSKAEDKTGLLDSVAKTLKKGGWAAVIEWYKKETKDGPPPEQCLSEDEVVTLAEAAGFRFSERSDLNGKHYMVILRK